MKRIIGCFALFLSLASYAQENSALLLAENPAHFYCRAQVGAIAGDVQTIGVNVASGYQFRFGLETGVSFGRENYTYNYSPLLAEVNYAFPVWKSIQPFAGINGGTMVNLSPYHYYPKSVTGCFGARIGFTRLITKHVGWTTSIGYRYMQLFEPVAYIYDVWPYNPGLIIIDKHVVELRIGLELR